MPERDLNVTRQYLFGPLCLRSDFALPGLLPAPDERSSTTAFVLHWETPPDADSLQQQRFSSLDGDSGDGEERHAWLSVGRLGSDFYLRFTDGTGFRVSPDAGRLDCFAAPGTSEWIVRHRLYHTVLPFALSLSGFLTLHGAAVKTPGGAVGFLGAAGAGKSTLAAAFVARGFPLICDDTLIFSRQDGHLFAVPAYPGLRLWEDSWSLLNQDGGTSHWQVSPTHQDVPKHRVQLPPGSSFDPQPVPFSRLYLLDPPASAAEATVQFAPIPAREGFLLLIHHSYPLDAASPGRLAADFEQAAALVSAGIWRLGIPRSLGLTDVVDAILQHVKETASELRR
jgi:hypothetical protein